MIDVRIWKMSNMSNHDKVTDGAFNVRLNLWHQINMFEF